ncbi:MAG: DNA polymerase III subunit chi [Pseudomonadota bacterium]
MAEVLFYHLTDSPLDTVLPEMLERSLARGWRVVVRGPVAAELNRLDAHLWTYRDDSFLPHGRAGGDHDAAQPVLLTDRAEVPNGAKVLMLVDGARVDPGEVGGFDRVCLIFNGHEEPALIAAREDWKAVTGAGLTGVYWAQDGGRWIEKARAER